MWAKDFHGTAKIILMNSNAACASNNARSGIMLSSLRTQQESNNSEQFSWKSQSCWLHTCNSLIPVYYWCILYVASATPVCMILNMRLTSVPQHIACQLYLLFQVQWCSLPWYHLDDHLVDRWSLDNPWRTSTWFSSFAPQSRRYKDPWICSEFVKFHLE